MFVFAAVHSFVDWEGCSWWRKAAAVATAPIVLAMHATNPSLELGARPGLHMFHLDAGLLFTLLRVEQVHSAVAALMQRSSYDLLNIFTLPQIWHPQVQQLPANGGAQLAWGTKPRGSVPSVPRSSNKAF